MTESEYLFVFGYHSPEDAAATDKFQADQESLGFFRIIASSAEQALEWGKYLSGWYVTQLFRDEDGTPHWNPKWFASWIEREPDERLRQAAQALPVVTVGEYPDFRHVKEVFGD